jgi:hypothetical protein
LEYSDGNVSDMPPVVILAKLRETTHGLSENHAILRYIDGSPCEISERVAVTKVERTGQAFGVSLENPPKGVRIMRPPLLNAVS